MGNRRYAFMAVPPERFCVRFHLFLHEMMLLLKKLIRFAQIILNKGIVFIANVR